MVSPHRFIAVLLFSVLPASFAVAAPQQCGVISAQSGPLAPPGMAIVQGMQLAIEEAGKDSPLKLIFEDDQFQPRLSVTAANKLIREDKVDCLVVFGSTTSLAVAEIADRSKIPMIGIALAPSVSKNRKYVYRFFTPIEEQVTLITDEITRRKYGKIAALTSIQDATQSLREELLKARPNFKFQIDEQLNLGDTDFRSILARIAKSQIDAVFLNMLPPQTSIAAKQLRALGFKGDFFGGPPLSNRYDLDAAEGAFEGAWLVKADQSKHDKMVNDYEKLYRVEPEPEASYGYEATKLLIHGAELGSIGAYLAALEKEGVNAKPFPVEGRTFTYPGTLIAIKNNKFEPLS